MVDPVMQPTVGQHQCSCLCAATQMVEYPTKYVGASLAYVDGAVVAYYCTCTSKRAVASDDPSNCASTTNSHSFCCRVAIVFSFASVPIIPD